MTQADKKDAKTAWVIAIGDELISGQRLDTNSQWISQRLEQLGIQVTQHRSIGDDLEAGIETFSKATQSADVIVCTGGIGPTKDDLTRHVLAEVAGAELLFHPESEQHIKSIFASYGREMPENNRIQAYFPEGATIINNAEGTAPGIDLVIAASRVFALPGVPYEMKQMWDDHVEKALVELSGKRQVIRHHAIHCFGAGESQIELMLDGLTDRGREPRVGITASHATISLRITATAESENECEQSILSTVDIIQSRLGQLVFGVNGQELQDVVVQNLQSQQQTLAIVDYGFGGNIADLLHGADPKREVFLGASVQRPRRKISRTQLPEISDTVRREFGADYAIGISGLYKSAAERMFDVAITSPDDAGVVQLKYAGHSGLRKARTAKQVLNEFRLFLIRD